MLRSRLEQQLADATFEGEDIDEDELRDISGRARFLIRKLGSKGWFEKERGADFREYITVPGYSAAVCSRCSTRCARTRPRAAIPACSAPIPRSRSRHEIGTTCTTKMAAVYGAYDNTQRARQAAADGVSQRPATISRCSSTCTTSARCSRRYFRRFRAEGDGGVHPSAQDQGFGAEIPHFHPECIKRLGGER